MQKKVIMICPHVAAKKVNKTTSRDCDTLVRKQKEKSDDEVVVPPPPRSNRRVVCEKWNLTDADFEPENQMQTIAAMSLAVEQRAAEAEENASPAVRIGLDQLRTKLRGYMYQDKQKGTYSESQFVNLPWLLRTMQDTHLCCIYCQQNMDVFYTTRREKRQWTLDRIDNTQGHNVDNCYLACLDCNLKRRCRSDKKFLFTKQLHITKVAP